jgi:DNA-binding IclR family transcriptional regulator
MAWQVPTGRAGWARGEARRLEILRLVAGVGAATAPGRGGPSYREIARRLGGSLTRTHWHVRMLVARGHLRCLPGDRGLQVTGEGFAFLAEQVAATAAQAAEQDCLGQVPFAAACTRVYVDELGRLNFEYV